MFSDKCKKGRIVLLIGLGTLFLFLPSSQVLSLVQTVMLNGREYTLSGEKWYVEDAGHWYEVVEDAITVKFKQGVSAKQMDEFNSSVGVRIIRKNRLGYYDLRLPSGHSSLKAAQQYIDSGLVKSAEVGGYGIYLATPNDTLYSSQYHLNLPSDHDIDAPQGWNIEKGDSSIVISIIDSGVDIDHEDLSLNMWKNTADPVNGDDDDGNGYTDDYDGWDFYFDDENPTRGIHGTCCAGIASAVMNNTSGVASLAGGWQGGTRGARIMPLGLGGSPDVLVVDDAILYAVDMGADVISMSFGVYSTSAIDDAIDTAYAHGVVLVGASGNSSNASGIYYPARARHVIGVGAIDTLDVKASYSNYGDSLDVVTLSSNSLSPGVLTTDYTGAAGYDSTGNYHRFTETSAACPQVAGLAALLLSFDSTLTPDEVTEIICRSADKVGNQTYSDWANAPYGAWDDSLGYGRINVFKALFRAKGYGNITTDVTWHNDITLKGDVTINSGVTLTISPGTEVRFAANSDDQSGGSDASKCELIVEGTLDVNGTSSDKVTFTSSASTPQAGDWYGIFFKDDSSVDLDHATISYAKYGIKGDCNIDPMDLTVNHSTIRNCSVEGVRLEYWSGTATLENTTIKDNGSKGIYALYGGTLSLNADSLINNGSYHAYLGNCALQANNCVFTDNDGMGETGIRGHSVSGAVDSSEFSDHYHHVYVGSNNGGMTLSDTNFDLGAYHIYNSSADTVEAEDNYWGPSSNIASRMYGPVDWDPYRQGPVGRLVLTSGRGPVPASFDLMQNFPNPFNPVTVIRYQIPRLSVKDRGKQERVVLEIYNLLGQRVRKFVERTAIPGRYTVTWDSRDEEGRALASGLYFCRMQVGSFVKTNKMLLLR